MARIRSIHPGAPLDEDVASMSLAARYVWAYLPCHADREGRLKDSAFTLKAAIFPGEPIDMEAVLAELAAREHIIRYEVAGKRYIQIRTFKKYQAPHTRENASTIPAMSGRTGAEHDLGSARPGAEPAGVSSSPSSPDLDPGPDPISSGSESGSVAPPPVPVPLPGHRIWNAHDWRDRYGRAWVAQYGNVAYGDAGDTKACVSLGYLLDAFPEAERIAAQAKAPGMFAEFLANTEPRVVSRRHPFLFFVQEFGGLRVSKRAQRPRTRTEETIAALDDWQPPEVKTA